MHFTLKLAGEYRHLVDLQYEVLAMYTNQPGWFRFNLQRDMQLNEAEMVLELNGTQAECTRIASNIMAWADDHSLDWRVEQAKVIPDPAPTDSLHDTQYVSDGRLQLAVDGDDGTYADFNGVLIKNSPLSTRLKNAVGRYGLLNLGQLRRLPLEWYFGLEMIGEKSLASFIGLLRQNNLKLAPTWAEVRPPNIGPDTGVTREDWLWLPVDVLELDEIAVKDLRRMRIMTVSDLLSTTPTQLDRLFAGDRETVHWLFGELEKIGLNLLPYPESTPDDQPTAPEGPIPPIPRSSPEQP